MVDIAKTIHADPLSAYTYSISDQNTVNTFQDQFGKYIWRESIPINNGEIDIDAAVNMPSEINYYPVYLIRDHDFSNSDLNNVVNALFPDIVGVLGSDFSRYEIESELNQVKLGQIIAIDPITGQPTYSAYNGQERDIAQLEELLKNFPTETVTPHEKSGAITFGTLKTLSSNQNISYFETNQNMITMRKDRACKILTFSQVQDRGVQGDLYRSLLNSYLSTPGKSIDHEVETVISAICPSGIKKMKVEPALSVNPETNLINSVGYLYTFVRSIGENMDPPAYLVEADTEFYNDPVYGSTTPTASYETISIYANSGGVRYLCWANAFDPIRIQNQNVQLLPFAEIQSAVRSAAVSLFNRESLNLKGEDVKIRELTLTNTIQQNPEDSSSAFIAPAWLVYATADSEDHSEHLKFAFALSAIDGRFVPLVF